MTTATAPAICTCRNHWSARASALRWASVLRCPVIPAAAQAPHLHYEVIVNNTPVNAMTVELPENTSLSGDTLIAFQRQAEPMLAALESGETGTISVANYERDNDSDESLQ